jgi:hypothetical protein
MNELKEKSRKTAKNDGVKKSPERDKTYAKVQPSYEVHPIFSNLLTILAPAEKPQENG